MYIEFVIGYIMMGVLALLLIAAIVLLCIILKKVSNNANKNETLYSPYTSGNAYAGGRGTAICRNCATQFDSLHKICPKCGTAR